MAKQILSEEKRICLPGYYVRFPNTFVCNNIVHDYKKFNFEEVAIREKYYNGIDGILMERK